LSRSNFEKIFRLYNNNESINANKFSKYIYKAFDKDHNGYVDFNEFLLGVTLLSSNDKIVEKLRFVFDIYDLDGDGRINLKEMIKVITCLYDISELSTASLSMIGKISFLIFEILNSFILFKYYIGENSPEHIASEIIRKFDKDGNKSITQNEFIDGCLEYAQVRALIVPSNN
jgi:Ca2+-binding EF-hand superfamily protein